VLPSWPPTTTTSTISRLGANTSGSLAHLLTLWPLMLGLTSTDKVRGRRLFSPLRPGNGAEACVLHRGSAASLLVAANLAFYWFKTRRRAQPESPGVGLAGPAFVLPGILVAAAPMLTLRSRTLPSGMPALPVGILQSGLAGARTSVDWQDHRSHSG